MFRIESKVDTQSREYKDNYARNQDLVEEYKERYSEIREGGPKK